LGLKKTVEPNKKGNHYKDMGGKDMGGEGEKKPKEKRQRKAAIEEQVAGI